MSSAARTTKQALSHYVNKHPLTSLLDLYKFDEKNRLFVTVDKRLARVWKLPGFPAEVMSDDLMYAVSDTIARGINNFPVGCDGQYIRFTHNDIRNHLFRFAQYRSDAPFAKEISESIIKLQTKGANQGFFAQMSDGLLEQVKADLMEEVEEEGFRDQLSDTIDKGLQDGRYALTVDQYLIMYYKPKWAGNAPLIKSRLKRLLGGIGVIDTKSFYNKEVNKEINLFLSHCRKVENGLMSRGMGLDRVTGQGMVELLYRELNPERNLKIDPPVYSSGRTLREIVTAPDLDPGQSDINKSALYTPIETSDKGFRIGDTHYRATSAVDWPQKTFPGMVYDALRHNEGTGWAAINFHVGSQFGIRARVKIRRAVLDFRLEAFGDNPLLAPPRELSAKQIGDLEHVAKVTDPEVRDRDKIVEASLHVVSYGQDKDEVESRAIDLEEKLWGKGVYEEDQGDAVIHHTLPGNMRYQGMKLLQRDMEIPVQNLSDLVPLYLGYQGCGALSEPLPPEILVNNSQGEPIFINLLGDHVVAGHSLVVGGTGSGKTFFIINTLLQMTAKTKPKQFLVDKGRNYKVYTETMGGSYVELVTDEEDGLKPTCINPFYVGTDKDGNHRLPTNNEREFLRELLLSMIMTGTGGDTGISADVDREDSSLLLEALGTLFCPEILGTEVTLSDFTGHLKSQYGEKGRVLAVKLLDFTKEGVYGPLFDGPLGIDWDADVICFETDRMADSNAMPIAMSALFYQINNYCKYKLDRDYPKVVAIDEAWSALSNPKIAKKIAGFYRELRKYSTAVILISQTINDFARLAEASRSNDSEGGGILENTKHFFLLSASETDLKRGKEVLGLTDEELNAWANTSSLPPIFSECFYRNILKSDTSYSGRFRLYSNPVSLWIATSAPSDVSMRSNLIEEYIKSGMDIIPAQVKAVVELSQKHPMGSRFS